MKHCVNEKVQHSRSRTQALWLLMLRRAHMLLKLGLSALVPHDADLKGVSMNHVLVLT